MLLVVLREVLSGSDPSACATWVCLLWAVGRQVLGAIFDCLYCGDYRAV